MATPLAVLAGLIVPQPGEQGVPLCVSVQFAPLLLGSFVTVAVNCCVFVTSTLAVVGETDTAIGGVTVAVAVADFVASAADVATTLTFGFAGTVPGAVYVAALPLEVVAGAMVPQLGEHGVPLCVRVQFTPLLLGSFVTVAVNCCVAFTVTFAVGGETEAAMGGMTVTVAVADFVVSATEIALIVTWAGLGTADGAV
ncbi:MAG: hypothetical protein AUG83_00900 [Acidobacteria bacterium 13_1_20CM_4_57_11]|nr:MAG: hypothetical protein AUG83_00900 [Acidobacteria bacterium 13_1_20CM_4_57_11]